MKKLDVTPISNSAQFPVKKGTLQFLQLAYQEGFAGVVKALIGTSYDPALVYILYGCVNSGTYPVYTVTAGVVFFNGEIYEVDAASFNAGVNTAVWSLIETQYTTDADPVTLTDLTVVNVHDIRKLLLSAGVSGSGLADYSLAVRMNFIIPAQLNLTASGMSSISGTYPNLQVDTPSPAVPTHQLVWHGTLTHPTTVTKKFGSATVSGVVHNATGVYTVTHNIGHINYFVRGVARGATFYGFKSIDGVTNTSFVVRIADDDSGNDSDFEFEIFTYIP